MKTLPIPTLAIAGLALAVTSCCTPECSETEEVRRGQQASYARGVAAGRAGEVREQYHREQREEELPPPPVRKRYYKVPVSGYTDSDGVKYNDHEVILEIVQP